MAIFWHETHTIEGLMPAIIKAKQNFYSCSTPIHIKSNISLEYSYTWELIKATGYLHSGPIESFVPEPQSLALAYCGMAPLSIVHSDN